MEREIGEIFEYNGEWYQCVKSDTYCKGCVFDWNKGLCNDIIGNCDGFIFKKLEKVGDPITVNGKKVQLLKTIIANCDNCAFYKDNNCDFTCYPRKCYGGEEGTYVEINEDMEDNDDIRPYDELFSPGTVSNTKHLPKSNLKPFDLQKAKDGKPVCTRDWRKVRIICFDKVDKRPIVGLISDDEGEFIYEYLADGKCYKGKDDSYDLMMLPEKKEGWAKVRKDINLYDTKEEADRKMIGNDEYVTAKVCWEE